MKTKKVVKNDESVQGFTGDESVLKYDVGGLVKSATNTLAMTIVDTDTGIDVGYICASGLSIWFIPIRFPDMSNGVIADSRCPSPNTLIDYMFDERLGISTLSPYERCMRNIAYEIWNKCLNIDETSAATVLRARRTIVRKNDLLNFLHYTINNIAAEVISSTVYRVNLDGSETYLRNSALTPVYSKVKTSEELFRVVDVSATDNDLTIEIEAESQLSPHTTLQKKVEIKSYNDYYLYQKELSTYAEKNNVSFMAGSMKLTTTVRT